MLGAAGVRLARRHEKTAARAFHFAFGAGLGGAYGILVEYVPMASAGSGLPFGVLQMLFADEVSVPALGLSESPSQAPPEAHLQSLTAHVIYAMVTERTRRGLRGWI